jgi:transposase
MDRGDADGRHQARHEAGDYRRIEVITGERRRRNWTASDKARIVAESAEPGANISAVARRWSVSRGLLTVWRRQVGLVRPSPSHEADTALTFVPITIAGDDRQFGRDDVATAQGGDPALAAAPTGRIEVEVGGGRMIVTGCVDPAVAVAILGALRGAR